MKFIVSFAKIDNIEVNFTQKNMFNKKNIENYCSNKNHPLVKSISHDSFYLKTGFYWFKNKTNLSIMSHVLLEVHVLFWL